MKVRIKPCACTQDAIDNGTCKHHAEVDRVVKRSKLQGVAGLRQGLGHVIIPIEQRATLKCTRCDTPAYEAWLRYDDVNAARQKGIDGATSLVCLCRKHSMRAVAFKMHPKASREAESRATVAREKRERVEQYQNLDRYLSFLTTGYLDTAQGAAEVKRVFKTWMEWYGHEHRTKCINELNASVDSWLNSLTEAERTLAIIGRK